MTLAPTLSNRTPVQMLIADDDPFIRKILETMLRGWGHHVHAFSEGLDACSYLSAIEQPCLAILDWIMPGLDGIEICRKIRATRPEAPLYLILLTVNSEKKDIVSGLAAGANDYVTKPFHEAELHARIHVGMRMLDLQQKLSDRISELSQANAAVGHLQGLLPICSYCKSIRDDQNYWQRVEHYICAHSDVRFSHGICPNCLDSLLKEPVPVMAGHALEE